MQGKAGEGVRGVDMQREGKGSRSSTAIRPRVCTEADGGWSGGAVVAWLGGGGGRGEAV
jgi:hypothetical protein